jgi:hypothetical protein
MSGRGSLGSAAAGRWLNGVPGRIQDTVTQTALNWAYAGETADFGTYSASASSGAELPQRSSLT